MPKKLFVKQKILGQYFFFFKNRGYFKIAKIFFFSKIMSKKIFELQQLINSYEYKIRNKNFRQKNEI